MQKVRVDNEQFYHGTFVEVSYIVKPWSLVNVFLFLDKFYKPDLILSRYGPVA